MIDVLLATYRPQSEMLSEQIDSICAQRDVEINLIRREDEAGEGACANFAALLEKSTAPYVAFSDQDDVWLPTKLSRQMAAMRQLEAEWGSDAPLLVFSDSVVVDSDLKTISESLFDYIGVNPLRNMPRKLILQNTAHGNTILMNAALRRLVMPIPKDAVMHDHWTMLVASVFGHIAYINEPLILYRQHDRNIFGGVECGLAYYCNLIRRGRNKLRERLYANMRQAEAFAQRFGKSAPQVFRACAGFETRSWLMRRYVLLRNRIFKDGFVRNVGTLAVT